MSYFISIPTETMTMTNFLYFSPTYKSVILFKEYVPPAISYHLYFLLIFLSTYIFYIITYIFRVSNELSVYIYIFGIFLLFFIKKNCVFIIFVSFFDKVSNFRNGILTNQKPGLVIRNCQWNCIQICSLTFFVF